MLGLFILSLIPLNDKIGMATFGDSNSQTSALKMARKRPNGTHMNIARVARGVGLKANLPSWKIKGLGYLCPGREW